MTTEEIPDLCLFCTEKFPRDSDHECSVAVLRERVETLLGKIEELQAYQDGAQHELDRARSSLRWEYEERRRLTMEVAEQKDLRKTERQGLAAWLKRRIKQQEEALLAEYVSHETKRVMEIEVSILKRYQEIIVDGAHRNDDPLMMKFED
jgi:hypothetical protein